MTKPTLLKAALAAGLYASSSQAQSSCQSVLVPTISPPSVAAGWTAQLVASGLKKPRSIQFDNAGALLVVESGKGVSRFTFKDNGGTCLQVDHSTLLVNDTGLNHGLALSNDGTVLYASSVESVFAWAYDASTGAVTGESTEVVNGMSNNDLVTRTLLMSQKHEGTLIVSRGNAEDLDADALNASTGLGQIKAFDLTKAAGKPYNFNREGHRLGWGLRNAVGVAEHPVTGGIYSLDNSVDGAKRNDVDVHRDNPGEELNFHGFLNSTDEGANYGYPNCYSVWDTNIPDNQGLSVGSQISTTQSSTLNDTTCANDYVAPRLTFPAHYAPLDILFSKEGATAFVTFHGSFDKTDPVGYRLSSVAFNSASGEPVEKSDSKNALSDIISNPDVTKCPESCFRPVGLAWDSTGRLFVTSDATGEIYVVAKAAGTPTSTASGTLVTATGSPNGGTRVWSQTTALLGGSLAVVVAAMLMA